jgi:hypothetical protein
VSHCPRLGALCLEAPGGYNGTVRFHIILVERMLFTLREKERTIPFVITQSCGNHQSDCPAPPMDPTLSNGTVSPTDLSPVQPWPVGLKPVCSACARICPNKRNREMSEKTGNE